MERVSRETRSFVIVVHYNVVSSWAKLVAKWAKCQALFLYRQIIDRNGQPLFLPNASTLQKAIKDSKRMFLVLTNFIVKL